MRNHLLLTLLPVLCLVFPTGCQWEKNPAGPECQTIDRNEPFTATLNEWYCLESVGWNMRLGPVLEDSRCNHPLIDCIWAGRLVMIVTWDDGTLRQDTFNTSDAWRDTLISGPYTVFLNKIYPETHIPGEAVDSALYAFDMIVK